MPSTQVNLAHLLVFIACSPYGEKVAQARTERGSKAGNVTNFPTMERGFMRSYLEEEGISVLDS